MGNPGKEGPKVGKQLWQLWNCFSERSSSLSAQHEAVELRLRLMRFFLCETFNPQRQTLFRKSPFGLSPRVQAPSLHLIMFCAALLYVLALDVVAMATVFYHSNRGNVELRGGDILAFAPSRLQLKVVFFFSGSCWKTSSLFFLSGS